MSSVKGRRVLPRVGDVDEAEGQRLVPLARPGRDCCCHPRDGLRPGVGLVWGWGLGFGHAGEPRPYENAQPPRTPLGP